MFKKTTLSLAAAIALLAPTIASASDIETVSASVKIADLDLNTEKGQARLNARIKSAARAVCQTNNGRSLSEKAMQTKCVNDALALAKKQADVAVSGSQADQDQAINWTAVTAKNS